MHQRGDCGRTGLYNRDAPHALAAPTRIMATVEDLAERVERLLMRHDELGRTAALLQQKLASVTQERDSLRSRLNAARGRIDALLSRLPADVQPSSDGKEAAP